MPLPGSSFGGRRGIKSPDPGPFVRKPPKANLTEGFAFAKPTSTRKPPKRLQSKGRLQRKTRINPRRLKPRRGPWRSKEHRAKVRALPCAAPNAPVGCSGPIQCSHLDTGLEKGMGMKAGDQMTAPQCRKHHSEWEERRGVFAKWSREDRAKYADEATHETQIQTGLIRGAA
jgi:hypothetical protein